MDAKTRQHIILPALPIIIVLNISLGATSSIYMCSQLNPSSKRMNGEQDGNKYVLYATGTSAAVYSCIYSEYPPRASIHIVTTEHNHSINYHPRLTTYKADRLLTCFCLNNSL